MFRIAKSLLIIVFTASIASGATWGCLSDQENSSGNIFSAGSITVDVAKGGDPDSISGMLPGDCKDGTVAVENTGTLPAYFWMRFLEHHGSAGLWDELDMTIRDHNHNIVIFDDKMKNFSRTRISDASFGAKNPAPSGESQEVDYHVCLPDDADEILENQTLYWTFEVTASSGADDYDSADYPPGGGGGDPCPGCGGSL